MAQARRTIAVITGSRAEFGLLQPVMRAVADHPALALRTIVCGAHLLDGTERDVRAGGFAIDARVPMQKRERTGRAGDVAAVGRGVSGIGEALTKLRPDAVLVLGDRIEAFAGAAAASIGGLVLGHLHGGDRAEGVADEAMRHAISKLAHLHFAATAQSRRRLIRMGEQPEQVWNVGSPAVDGLKQIEPAVDAPRLIVIQHPIGAGEQQEQRWMAATLKATEKYQRLVMQPNYDPGRAGVMAAIEAGGVEAVDHLPRQRWLALLAGAEAIVGNSSAGLIEAAVLRTPCVNIGPRQAGRQKPGNVIDCDYGRTSVGKAVTQALRVDLSGMRHPYGKGQTGRRVAELLAEVDLQGIGVRKRNSY